jgi:hypothetical protein
LNKIEKMGVKMFRHIQLPKNINKVIEVKRRY